MLRAREIQSVVLRVGRANNTVDLVEQISRNFSTNRKVLRARKKEIRLGSCCVSEKV
jgi:hypothetical protein